jgi:hypothetical protein
VKGHVKQKVSAFHTGITIVPASKAKHPRADVHDTNEQKKTQPFIATTFVIDAFSQ